MSCHLTVRISQSAWKYALPPDRVAHLDGAPKGGELMNLVMSEIKANISRASFCWQAGLYMKGCCRAKANVPFGSAPLYDWLFNGPTGYRAHYYSSENEGEAFNQLLVVGLVSALLASPNWKEFDRSIEGLGERSFRGPWSKLGFDDAAFKAAPPRQLLADRWVNRGEGMGLRAPLPAEPVLQFSGTWIDLDSRECRLDQMKSDRSCDIWKSGFA